MKQLQLFRKIWMLTLILGLWLPALFAQTPPDGLNGADLKDWLKANYYDGKHVQLGYTTARVKMYNFIDNHNNTITCVYSGYEQSWTYGGTGSNPDPINCEHTVPQSFFNEAEPMKSDLHHLFPTYSNWNSTRSNYPFAEIDDNTTAKWMYLTTSLTTIPTSNIDLYSEYANSTFEPREDHKGDVARAIFYFYTMYPTQAGDISQVADINTLYDWHLADPVSQAEIDRNLAIETYQGDLNPYITMPELVARAWGFASSDPTVPSAPTLQLTVASASLNLSWTNVANENGYYVYRSVNSGTYSNIATIAANTTAYTDNNVSEGNNYAYYVKAYNDLGSSVSSNVVSGQLSGSTGGDEYATELILSEYVEGSSYNKALEIANFTGATVDLSNYSIFKQTNGAGDWASELTLSGTLAHGDVYVIVNSSAASTLLALADLSTSSQALTFNGNDPVALFKNGTLIDVIGTFNSTATFGVDKTLVRNSDITSPSTTYNESDWTSYASDTYTYLGSHTMDLGSGTVADTEAPTAPSNFASSNITTSSLVLTWSASTDNVAVTDYLVYKDGTLEQTVSSTSCTITGLSESTQYSFTVIASDEAGNLSAASSALSVTTLTGADTQAPTAPTNLASSNITISSVVLSWSASNDNVGVTNYLVYKNGALDQTVSATSCSITGLSVSTQYSFTVKATDAAGNVSVASSALVVTTNSGDVTYCTSQGTNYTYEWIAGVSIGSFINTSGAAGYTDYTAKEVPLETGLTYSVSLTPGFASSTYNEYWKIWIDYDGNGDFDDTELAFDAGSLSSSAVSGSITIPSTTSGTTRMRVSMKYNASQTACETFSYGEVEDYTVVISESTPDTQAPTAPASLTASSVSNNSVTLRWNASSDNVGVTGYQVFQGGSKVADVASTSATISGLSAATSYSFYVKALDAAGNLSAASSTLNVTTTEVSLTYCTSKGSNSTYEWIDLVQFGDMTNSTGNDGGYADYTSNVATIAIGSNTIYYSCGFKSTSYVEYWHVWIDLNHNGTFDDTERLVYGTSSSSGTLSSALTIPSSAQLGTTRMRVTMKYNGTATSCENFTYGEVEDYTVNIVDVQSGSVAQVTDVDQLSGDKLNDIELYPNPASTQIQLDFNSERQALVTITDITGRLLYANEILTTTETLQISDFENGVYFLSVLMDGKQVTKRFVKQ